MLKAVRHLLIPTSKNKYRAGLIRFEGLIVLTVFLLLIQSILYYGKRHTSVLGYASQISIDEVVKLTNLEREQQGLNTLQINQDLVRAAEMKGRDMIADNYWSHVAPDGTDPWYFFGQVGYSYRYAGENLARDFSNPSDAVIAWMASPSHRENMLSDKYKEIGVAVVEGDLNGEDTTIIVQLFGTSSADRLPVIPVASAGDEEVKQLGVVAEVNAQQEEIIEPSGLEIKKEPSLTVSPFMTTKNISITVLGFLFMILIADFAYIESNGISKKRSRALAHISFFTMVFVILMIARSGEII